MVCGGTWAGMGVGAWVLRRGGDGRVGVVGRQVHMGTAGCSGAGTWAGVGRGASGAGVGAKLG